MSEQLGSYVGRLCWNSRGWTEPTGEAAQVEIGTYVTEYGFGHEEWLFAFQWILDGWKYAFIQPVNRSYQKLEGKRIDVSLYTIGPKRDWFYVGRLPECEVVTQEQAKATWAEFRKRGWSKDMEAQIKAVGGDLKGLKVPAHLIFNIRFRPEHAEPYENLVPVGAGDSVRKLKRYTLTEIQSERRDIAVQWPHRRGRQELHKAGRQDRKPVGAVQVTLGERQLQNELFNVLRRRFGNASVSMEEDFVDLCLRVEKTVHLFEVKQHPQSAKAIREALGQLLQYACALETKGEKVGKLIVAAPGELDELGARFLDHLRTSRGLPIHYHCLRRGAESIDLPL